MKQRKYFYSLLITTAFLLCCHCVQAKITRIVITKIELYNNGKTYGNTGQYERLYGQAYGEVDPGNPLNRVIQDIDLAPVNGRGRVEYMSEFIVLRPKNMARNNAMLFLSLPNRGNVFDVDSVLLKRGYTVLWAAWQGDVLAGGNRLTMKVPIATRHGNTITGSLRTEYQVMDRTNTINLSAGYFNGNTHYSYETVSLNNKGLILTKRVHEQDARIKVPNSEWAFADCSTKLFPGVPCTTKISLRKGFDPDYIYELVYTAKNPLVLGLGFAAIRDVVSFFRSVPRDEVGNTNPVLTDGINTVRIRAAIMQGISQCGNFTRSFLQLGFNQDEQGRMVFEGVNTHIATRRISLNVRFGRPGGGGLQHEDHLFPSNEPPFTWDSTYEPVSGITGGILDKCMKTNSCPRIMQTLSSSEYWQLRASLRTTDPYGKKDLPIPANVRIYHFAGTQHIPSGNIDKVTGRMENLNSYAPQLRAVLVALENWVLNGTEPPPSCYATLADHALVNADKISIGWPDIPGVTYNGRLNDGPLIDYGPGYSASSVSGILREPPVELKNKQYNVLVPKVDQDGNEIGGVHNVNMRVPLGTYTGWSLRTAGYSEGDLAALSGMFIPLKKTKAERLASGDPRRSLEERYTNHAGYVEAVKKAADELVKEGFLLPDDVAPTIANAQKSNVLN